MFFIRAVSLLDLKFFFVLAYWGSAALLLSL